MTVLAEPRTIAIEPMRRRHLRSVLLIEERTSSTPWSLGLFLSECRREERLYLVARDASVDGAEVVGFAGMLFVLGEGHVTTIAVDPERQGDRIGTRLLLALMRGAIDHDTFAVTLEVRASNHAALALYRRFGFAPAGVRKDYYAQPTEDALVLWAHDVDTPEYATRLDAIEATLPLSPPVPSSAPSSAPSSVSSSAPSPSEENR